MKFYLNHLKESKSFESTCDFQFHIKNELDILFIQPTLVNGVLNFKNDILDVHLDIKTILVMACAKTLKPVDVSLDFSLDLVFGSSLEADYPLTNPIDLNDIVFGHILLEKPYTVYHPDAKDTSFEQKKGPHPAFRDLEKLLKK